MRPSGVTSPEAGRRHSVTRSTYWTNWALQYLLLLRDQNNAWILSSGTSADSSLANNKTNRNICIFYVHQEVYYEFINVLKHKEPPNTASQSPFTMTPVLAHNGQKPNKWNFSQKQTVEGLCVLIFYNATWSMVVKLYCSFITALMNASYYFECFFLMYIQKSIQLRWSYITTVLLLGWSGLKHWRLMFFSVVCIHRSVLITATRPCIFRQKNTNCNSNNIFLLNCPDKYRKVVIIRTCHPSPKPLEGTKKQTNKQRTRW